MKKFLNISAIFLSLIAKAQTIQPVRFQTPEVASFNRMIETPVSLFTGIPNISIPIYEIKIKEVNIPITLNYTGGGGIKVEEEATWVGLGWNLNYGGQISRKQRGVQDEKYFLRTTENGYSNFSISNYNSLPQQAQDPFLNERYNRVGDAKRMMKDYMPDEFNYSALGYSGRYMFNQSQNRFILFPKEDIKISYVVSDINTSAYATGNYYIDSWDMKMPNGVTCKFGTNEASTYSRKLSDADYIRNSWNVKSIQNTFGEMVSFNYQPYTYTAVNLESQTYSTVSSLESNQVANTIMRSSNISTIGFPEGSIEFVTTSRIDMPTTALSRIYVKDFDGNVIKTIEFVYSYFEGSFNPIPGITLSNDYKNKRLRLDKIRIIGNNLQPFEYQFDYNYSVNGTVPSKYSFSQDFWGFFNGEFNSTLIPKTINSFGANRKASTYNNIFSLKSIRYPEGGKTEFLYECNEAKTDGIPLHFLTLNSTPAVIANSANISVQGSTRDVFYNINPDFIDGYGQKYFKKIFTIPQNSFANVGDNFFCSSNFGGTALDSYLTCGQSDVGFKLERINPDGSRTTIENLSLRNCGNNVFSNNVNKQVILSAGNYEMTLVIKYIGITNPSNINQAHYTSFGVSWKETNTNTPSQNYFYTGGIRIKSIKNYSSESIVASEKQYYYNDLSTGQTSGRLLTVPKYHQYTTQKYVDTLGNSFSNDDVILYATSRVPLQTTGGAFMGYEYVTEELVGELSAENLKTQYSFSFMDPYYDINFEHSEASVIDAKEWLRGKTLSIQYLKNSQPVKQEFFSYHQISPHLITSSDEDYVEEINTDFISFQALAGRANNGYTPRDFVEFTNNGLFYSLIHKYNVANMVVTPVDGSINYPKLPYFKRYTAFDKPSGKKIVTIDNFGNKIENLEQYYYGSTPMHNQITKTETTSSTRQSIQSILKYPADLGAIQPYITMVQNNKVNTVIEQSNYKNSILINRKKTNYNLWNLPANDQQQIGAGALETKASYVFDVFGNIQELQKTNDTKVVYFWDEKTQQYPEVEAINANSSDIAFTTFEKQDLYVAGSGGWYFIGYSNSTQTNVPAGKRCFQTSINTSFTKQGLSPAKVYKVSYWSKNGQYSVSNTQSSSSGQSLGGWTFFEHVISGTTSVNVTGVAGFIDELKLCPSEGLITTYCYAPLIGLTSKCDYNNRYTYYEYDAFNRLSLIRDQDKNILKKFCYNYQGQQETCGLFPNAVASGTFTKSCTGNAVGSSVVYAVPAGKYFASTLAAANVLAQNDVTANGQNYANANGTCCILSFNWGSGVSNTASNISLSGSTVNFTLVFTPSSSNVTAGTIAGSCCYPNSIRTVPITIGSSVFNAIISTNGTVQIQLVSGAMPSGIIGFNGSYDKTAITYYSAAKSGTYTRSCSTGQLGSSVIYNVPAYKYTSTISQADADNKAQNDVTANGQNNANTVGTCTTAATITGSNSKSLGYAVIFTNGSYSQSFYINPGASNITLGSIPAGTYTVQFQPGGNPVSANFSIGSFTTYFVTTATFTNVFISTTTLARVF